MATYTQEEITKSLTAVAYRNGNIAAAHRDLEELGIRVGRTTLGNWIKTVHYEEYNEIRDRHKAQYELEAAAGMRDIIAMAEGAEKLAIEEAVKGINRTANMAPEKLAQAALQFSRIKQSNVEKLFQLEGRPSEIIEDRSAENALKALIARGVLKVSSNGNGGTSDD
jgi:hypothetical protein